MRLDVFLSKKYSDFSRSRLQKYIKEERVLVNGRTATKVNVSVSEDDKVEIIFPVKKDFSLETLPIIFEDENVIVIDKPAGILTHAKGADSEEFSVASFMEYRMTEPEQNNRPGIVHRLDRATSGVIICAKNQKTKKFLQKQFQDRKAHKEYLAIVDGIPKLERAEIDLPIERNPKRLNRFRVGASGKTAQTYYKTVHAGQKYSLLKLRPTTGRTHQLRVHLSYIGCPIVGDSMYDGSQSPIARMCLHAESLEITIPGGQRKTFRSKLPEDFINFVGKVKND